MSDSEHLALWDVVLPYFTTVSQGLPQYSGRRVDTFSTNDTRRSSQGSDNSIDCKTAASQEA